MRRRRRGRNGDTPSRTTGSSRRPVRRVTAPHCGMPLPEATERAEHGPQARGCRAPVGSDLWLASFLSELIQHAPAPPPAVAARRTPPLPPSSAGPWTRPASDQGAQYAQARVVPVKRDVRGRVGEEGEGELGRGAWPDTTAGRLVPVGQNSAVGRQRWVDCGCALRPSADLPAAKRRSKERNERRRRACRSRCPSPAHPPPTHSLA